MGIAVNRALVPSHFFQRKVLAWQCSVCRKLFCRTAEDTECAGGNDPPIYIESDFRIHNCAVVLLERQERRDAERPVRDLIDFLDSTRNDRQGGER